jgi:lipopolysaccharide/colanic/teichoic acid biosynthesis glycosyltransferase
VTTIQKRQKRFFDIVFSFLGLLFLWWIILLAAFIAWIDTGKNGFFTQKRVGKGGKLFNVIKIRSMRPDSKENTTVTTTNDPRISPLGNFWRKSKIDELPQLWNVLIGKMSFVGPRPDVPGFADQLTGEERKILKLRPGITGPASIKYKKEEELLASKEDPEMYNREVIWPDKVKINLDYYYSYSLWKDIKYIFQTLF